MFLGVYVLFKKWVSMFFYVLADILFVASARRVEHNKVSQAGWAPPTITFVKKLLVGNARPTLINLRGDN